MLLGLATIVMFLLNFVPKVNCELLEIQDPSFQGIVTAQKKQFRNGPNLTLRKAFRGKNFLLLKEILTTLKRKKNQLLYWAKCFSSILNFLKVTKSLAALVIIQNSVGQMAVAYRSATTICKEVAT